MHSNEANEKNTKAISQIAREIEREVAEALSGQPLDQLMDQGPPPAEPPPPGDQPAESSRVDYELKRGRISKIHGDDVYVDLTGVDNKMQGVVPLTQFERPPRLGSIMDFVIQRVDENEGLIYLSREGAVTLATWDMLQRGAVVEARVVATNKGGLELEIVGGIRGFMPASQVDLYHVDDLEPFVSQKLIATVQEVDRRGKGRVILSRRRYLEHQRQVAREKLLKELEPDQTREGTIKTILDYGAFVDLGGVDGLIHISDLSHSHVKDVKEVVSEGQKVTVKVLKIDKDTGRIRLGLKQVLPDPWDGIAARLRVGEQISGRVLRLTDFGVFVEVEAGVEGLVPLTELSWKRVHRPAEVVKEGDVMRMSVLAVDAEKRRISLSLKQAQGDPWAGAKEKYPAHSLVEATVVRLVEFGAFVEIETGLEGLVHISELSDKRVDKVEDVLKVGDKQQLRVLEVNEAERRIRLSLKAVKTPAREQAAPSAPVPAAPRAVRKPAKGLKGGMEKSAALGMSLRDLKL